MYAKAKIGGFLHLCIGEEATVVGSTQAMRESDYLLSTYREHGQAIARGTHPNAVMAELFGRVDGCSKGRGGSMHLFDIERRFLGGYGIVGGNLPLATGVALQCDYEGTDDAVVCMFGDGATNQGTFGESMNMAALWKLPVVFMVINNQFGMGTALERHSAVTDLSQEGRGLRRARLALRRHGRARRARRHHRGAAQGARGPPAAAARGRDLPLPRALDGGPGGVPHEGRGRGVAPARSDRELLQAARGRGRVLRRRHREARRRGDRRPWTRRCSSPTTAHSPTSTRSTTTSTCSAIRSSHTPGGRWTSARRSRTAASDEREAGRVPHELAEAGRRVRRRGRGAGAQAPPPPVRWQPGGDLGSTSATKKAEATSRCP